MVENRSAVHNLEAGEGRADSRLSYNQAGQFFFVPECKSIPLYRVDTA
jgi:hypothetical protein